MSFASCAQDLDSGEDTSADPILAVDASITRSGLVGVGVTDFAASFPRTRDVRRSAVRRNSQKRRSRKFVGTRLAFERLGVASQSAQPTRLEGYLMLGRRAPGSRHRAREVGLSLDVSPP